MIYNHFRDHTEKHHLFDGRVAATYNGSRFIVRSEIAPSSIVLILLLALSSQRSTFLDMIDACGIEVKYCSQLAVSYCC